MVKQFNSTVHTTHEPKLNSRAFVLHPTTYIQCAITFLGNSVFKILLIDLGMLIAAIIFELGRKLCPDLA